MRRPLLRAGGSLRGLPARPVAVAFLLAATAALFVAAPAVSEPGSASPTVRGAALRGSLAASMRQAGPYSGAFVFNATDRRTVFRWRPDTPRILASNTKLFTTAAALGRIGARNRLRTRVLGTGFLDKRGVWRGNLYLRGGGDPTFGSGSFAKRAYGARATVGVLARRLRAMGIRRVRGRVFGDESRFDARRGGPGSGFRTSIYVGPLSALSYNRGLANSRGTAFQGNPPRFAAARLTQALERRGVPVRRRPLVRRTPRRARALVTVRSPSIARLARLTNTPSDNFFAEMLLKGLGAKAYGWGTTRRGARVVARFARRLRSRVWIADGSGLSRRNRTSPRRVVRLLGAMRRRAYFRSFFRSLALAGREGTVAHRMRRGPARGRCRAKTGTLSNVSVLSGYCRSRSGDLYVFSILMNGVSPPGARALQDRMAHAIAGVRR
jgi:serine-type D-Ala-D-Ala carboxypeptidase/endopeptidase (penicillin-binding protein 4)